jgi:hypothetical protein
MQTIPVHGFRETLPEFVDFVLIHVSVRSVIAHGNPAVADLWQRAFDEVTPEILLDILVEGMDLAEALDRVESWVVLGA